MRPQLLEKSREIVRYVIDMCGVAAHALPILPAGFARLFARGRRYHQHGRHAKRMRHFEIARQILEHRRADWDHAMRLEKAIVGRGRRFWIEFGGDDVKHVLEMAVQFKPRHDGISVFLCAVGEDQLAARQFFQRSAERRIRLDRRVVDLVHDLEIFVRLHAMFDHQPAHRRPVALVIILLDFERALL